MGFCLSFQAEAFDTFFREWAKNRKESCPSHPIRIENSKALNPAEFFKHVTGKRSDWTVGEAGDCRSKPLGWRIRVDRKKEASWAILVLNLEFFSFFCLALAWQWAVMNKIALSILIFTLPFPFQMHKHIVSFFINVVWKRWGRLKRISGFIAISSLFHYIACVYPYHNWTNHGKYKKCNHKIYEPCIYTAAQ